MNVELRDYQQKMVDNLRKSIQQGNQNIIGVLGCGGGKTVIQASIARMAIDRGGTVLFIVHRKEIIEQAANTFAKAGVDMHRCGCEMIQTLARRVQKEGVHALPTMLLIDECHHVYSNQYQRLLEAFNKEAQDNNRKLYIVGFTATPIRMKEGGLGKVFTDMVESVSVKWLIEHHYLAPCQMKSIPLINREELKRVRAGDYAAADVAAIMEKTEVYGSAVENYLKFAKGKQTIVYAATIKASKGIVDSYTIAGVSAVHLDGNTPKAEREQIVDGFRNGKITVLSNVDLFGEGFDVPDCECVQLLRPTASLSLHIQQSMRSMRYKPGKTALILDHVGNLLKHGSPTADRTWSLNGKDKKEKDLETKVCPKCFNLIESATKVCPHCGLEFDLTIGQKKRRQKLAKAGELLDVTDEDLEMIRQAMKFEQYKKTNNYKICKGFEDLKIFAAAHDYKWQWAIHKAVEMGEKLPNNIKSAAYRLGYRVNQSGVWYHG